MLKGPITTELPASFLQLHPHATVMLDLAAIRR
jgi:6-phosphogluconolactonase/glucosamine-6-phosphate isomerase/deaminase